MATNGPTPERNGEHSACQESCFQQRRSVEFVVEFGTNPAFKALLPITNGYTCGYHSINGGITDL